ncbi:MAG: hypothetical protein HQL95_15205, partial [Magnetococcales bacterium]|nr:hypothetical protein [Magnetococcales bacterium]
MSDAQHPDGCVPKRRQSDSDTLLNWLKYLVPVAASGLGLYVSLVVGPVVKDVADVSAIASQVQKESIKIHSMVNDLMRRIEVLEKSAADVKSLVSGLQGHAESDNTIHVNMESAIRDNTAKLAEAVNQINTLHRNMDKLELQMTFGIQEQQTKKRQK